MMIIAADGDPHVFAVATDNSGLAPVFMAALERSGKNLSAADG